MCSRSALAATFSFLWCTNPYSLAIWSSLVKAGSLGLKHFQSHPLNLIDRHKYSVTINLTTTSTYSVTTTACATVCKAASGKICTISPKTSVNRSLQLHVKRKAIFSCLHTPLKHKSCTFYSLQFIRIFLSFSNGSWWRLNLDPIK